MAADGLRMDAYARAIARLVRPGSVVVDIGAGTGIFSLLAARAGAKQVHAIEPNPAVWLLADLARENGLADRITIHHASSYDVELAQKADVVVSDLRGSTPFHEEHLAVLRDAKARLLTPQGVLLPARDDLFVALFENDELARYLARGTAGFDRYGLSAHAVTTSVFNTPVADESRLRSNDLVSTAGQWASVAYGSPSTKLEGSVELSPRRRGIAHGLAVWFAATIHDDIGYSTEPGTATVYSRIVLPLIEPIAIDHGDRIALTVRVNESGQQWAWEVSVTRPDGSTVRARQASFFGLPTSPDALLRTSADYKPVRAERGERATRVLSLMDGTRTVTELATVASVDEVRGLVARYAK